MARGSGPTAAPQAPPAVRSSAPGWRDPRLWVGVAVVAVSVVAGSRLLASADDTVQVWAVAGDIGAGDRLEERDLVATRVRFADEDQLATYLAVTDELPADLRLTRGLAAGELVPRAALAPAREVGTVELPLAVDPEQVPPSVGPGSVVDVYVLTPGGRRAGTVDPVLAEVAVVDAPSAQAAIGTSGKQQLVVAVEEADAAAFFGLLRGSDQPVISVVRRG